jgi:hypothetical protein
MLFAEEFPSITASQLGSGMMVVGALLWFWSMVKGLFPKKTPGQEYVTKTELEVFRSDVKKDMGELKSALTTQHDRFESYTHARLKELSDNLSGIQLKLEQLHRELQSELFSAVRYLSGGKFPQSADRDEKQGQ